MPAVQDSMVILGRPGAEKLAKAKACSMKHSIEHNEQPLESFIGTTFSTVNYSNGAVQAAAEELWRQVLAQLRLQMLRATFEAWLQDSRAPTILTSH